ncbi:MAG: hypothetical protein F4X65_06685 [Chloroflexi bacterium]|nr:hypothetical protein [Chloroflexota bacterium]
MGLNESPIPAKVFGLFEDNRHEPMIDYLPQDPLFEDGLQDPLIEYLPQDPLFEGGPQDPLMVSLSNHAPLSRVSFHNLPRTDGGQAHTCFEPSLLNFGRHKQGGLSC